MPKRKDHGDGTELGSLDPKAELRDPGIQGYGHVELIEHMAMCLIHQDGKMEHVLHGVVKRVAWMRQTSV